MKSKASTWLTICQHRQKSHYSLISSRWIKWLRDTAILSILPEIGTEYLIKSQNYRCNSASLFIENDGVLFLVQLVISVDRKLDIVLFVHRKVKDMVLWYLPHTHVYSINTCRIYLSQTSAKLLSITTIRHVLKIDQDLSVAKTAF